MDDDQVNGALAFYAGALHGFFRSWQELEKPWKDFLRQMAQRKRREHADYEIFVHHGSALIGLRLALERLQPPDEGKLARTLLLAAMQSRLDALDAALKSNIEDHAQRLADTSEDMRAYLAAWRGLCALAGLPDDAIGG